MFYTCRNTGADLQLAFSAGKRSLSRLPTYVASMFTLVAAAILLIATRN